MVMQPKDDGVHECKKLHSLISLKTTVNNEVGCLAANRNIAALFCIIKKIVCINIQIFYNKLYDIGKSLRDIVNINIKKAV